jgi:hypothetical protein
VIITPNGVVRSAAEDKSLEALSPECKRILTEEIPKFVAWLNEPHPEIERGYREGKLGRFVNFDFFKDEAARR